MKKTNLTLTLIVLSLLTVSIVSAFGFGNGLFNQKISPEERNEEREALQNAIENNDFDSWKSIMEERISLMRNNLTIENFNLIKEKHLEREEFRVKMQEAIDSGDFEQIQSLKEEYGIGNNKNHMGRGNGQNKNFQRGNCLLNQN